MNLELMKAVSAAIKAHPHHFNMSEWYRHDGGSLDDDSCGTRACLAGWTLAEEAAREHVNAASEVEVFTQRRYRCPHCRRSWASKARATTHVAECPHSPATRACATCEHLDEPCCSTPNDSCGCHGLFRCLKGIPLEEFRQDWPKNCSEWELRR